MAAAELAGGRVAGNSAGGRAGPQARVPTGIRRRCRGHGVERMVRPAGDAAIMINRVDVITMVVILAALLWIVGRVCGPVQAAGWRG